MSANIISLAEYKKKKQEIQYPLSYYGWMFPQVHIFYFSPFCWGMFCYYENQ